MFTIPWIQELVTQSGHLNDEHHQLLDKLNGLLVALDSQDPTRIAMACSALACEAEAHFDSEEGQMREAGYPDLERHCRQHEDLRRLLSSLMFAANSDATSLSSMDMLSSLERWFVPHLTYADKKAAEFMAMQTP